MGLKTILLRQFDARFRPLFVAGVAGSGTTLLSGLVDQRFRSCACLHESARRAEPSSPLHIGRIEAHASLAAYEKALFLPEDLPASALRQAAMRLYRAKARYPKRSNVVIDKAPNCHLVRMARLREAFPDSKLLVLFRDPVASVEGLRRKWPRVFGGAPLEEVCGFWERLHLRILADGQRFPEDVLWIAYEDLVRDPEAWLAEIGTFGALAPRARPRKYADKPNQPGKGLRNVADGVIHVVDPAAAATPLVLDEHAARAIRTRLGELHERMRARSRPPHGIGGCGSVPPASR